MPKHKSACRSQIHLIEHLTGAATFRLSAWTDARAIYLFEFQLDLAFRIDGPALTVAAEIVNLDPMPIPASFGNRRCAGRWRSVSRTKRTGCCFQSRGRPDPLHRHRGLPRPKPTPVSGTTLVPRDDLFVDDALIFDKLVSRSVC